MNRRAFLKIVVTFFAALPFVRVKAEVVAEDSGVQLPITFPFVLSNNSSQLNIGKNSNVVYFPLTIK